MQSHEPSLIPSTKKIKMRKTINVTLKGVSRCRGREERGLVEDTGTSVPLPGEKRSWIPTSHHMRRRTCSEVKNLLLKVKLHRQQKSVPVNWGGKDLKSLKVLPKRYKLTISSIPMTPQN